MLPRNRRIPRKMFPLVRNGCKTFKNKLFLLRTVSKSEHNTNNSRFCFSVSKKLVKGAVLRNRLRRSGYRILNEYINKVRPDTLAVFSFVKIPTNDEEILYNLHSILKESKLIR